ncbi:hypothetical protein RHSIM_Rhsim06G0056100 [Rhododendron simsii]|uniref:Protein kinase domain-containing protein n=1 Tax=Rhododendron simsii TaxID=118357 RepID=A0A834LMP9_RHOSS|nr:hypothetical protein RHSIM_Rhsim06G0056100 [Rhododendron simsii]
MLSNPVSSNFLTLNSMATISIPKTTTPWKGVRKYAYKTVNATASFSRIAANLIFTVVIRSHGCLKDLDPRHLGFLSTKRLENLGKKSEEEVVGLCAKGLKEANQGEAKLLAEFMERESLAENLISGALDWVKRFDIAVGSVKGLAYLHEECLEWVLHCDVRPQNILLDSPKAVDFSLSKQ